MHIGLPQYHFRINQRRANLLAHHQRGRKMSQAITDQTANVSASACVIGSDELHLRRMHKQMSARNVPRRFFWSNPQLGVAVVMDFRPENNLRQTVPARRFLPAG
jgi:hypothetical protein